MENAGDVLVSAYKSTEDSVILNNLITFALRSYEDAVLKDGNDVDLKIKLADAYVQGSQEPMKGIGILRQLSDSLPDNVPVLLALGRLSIQSGQYDKAKERLQKILQLEPQNTEALYFLAITEAQLGHDDEAIRLFEMCKLLVNNIEFNKEIDEIVKNLKSKKV
jgi:cytochrome c-type biogenesis protein CcmH/NrfG